MASGNGLFKRCECRDLVTGHRLGSRCPQLAVREHGSWYFRLELPPGKNGKRRQLRRGRFASRKAAGATRDFLHNPTTPDSTSGSAVAVAQRLRLWLESRENLAPSTMRSYAMHVRRHLRPSRARWTSRYPRISRTGFRSPTGTPTSRAGMVRPSTGQSSATTWPRAASTAYSPTSTALPGPRATRSPRYRW
jgi:hypothetical protein